MIIGAAIIFSGCSKDDSLAPISQNDQEINLKAKKEHAHFTGKCTPLPPIYDVNAWYDATDDLRTTGTTIWMEDDETDAFDGTALLLVGALNPNDDNHGIWDITWSGEIEPTAEGGLVIVVHAVGIGTEGSVEGLTARWKYKMDYDGTPETFMYVIKGKITEVL